MFSKIARIVAIVVAFGIALFTGSKPHCADITGAGLSTDNTCSDIVAGYGHSHGHRYPGSHHSIRGLR